MIFLCSVAQFRSFIRSRARRSKRSKRSTEGSVTREYFHLSLLLADPGCPEDDDAEAFHDVQLDDGGQLEDLPMDRMGSEGVV